MNILYMHCPNCGADVPPRARCGACSAFAMSKMLYWRLQEIASGKFNPKVRSKETSELVRLGFVQHSPTGYVVTGVGMATLSGLVRI